MYSLAMTVTSRICTKCSLTKPLDDFSAAPRGRYGRKSSCKECDAARHAKLTEGREPKPRGRAKQEPKNPEDPKTCRKCGVTKTFADFSLSRQATETQNSVYRSDCKECCSARALQWFHNNKERHRETKHRWVMEKTYGISAEKYAEMLVQQNGVCAICGEDEAKAHGRTGTKFRLCVDHCHITGRVRGLLCQTCNRVIGLFKDDVERHLHAIDYLRKNSSEQAPPGV